MFSLPLGLPLTLSFIGSDAVISTPIPGWTGVERWKQKTFIVLEILHCACV